MATELTRATITLSNTMAGTAPPVSLIHAGVFRRVFMALRTACLLKIAGSNRVASHSVIPTGTDFQVIWVNTSPVEAQVIKGHSVWNWTAQLFVGKSVRHFHASTNRGVGSVSTISVGQPLPTRSVTSDGDLLPEQGDLVASDELTSGFITHGNRIPCLVGGVS